jgi:flavin reductase (DIM6/NTAB) family NADH-FMN oxidoreductase RutF
MDFTISELSQYERYKFLSALVIPRPVAFITTKNVKGQHNAAPFSFFNLFSEDPALVVLGFSHRPDGRSKDTINNIRSSQQFVVNMVDKNIIGAMHIASADFGPDESEIDFAGIHLSPSNHVDVMRITEAPVSLECKLFEIKDLTQRRALVMGEVLSIHLKDDIFDSQTRRIIPEKYSPIARLYGNEYAWLGQRYTKAIPSRGRYVKKVFMLGIYLKIDVQNFFTGYLLYR